MKLTSIFATTPTHSFPQPFIHQLLLHLFVVWQHCNTSMLKTLIFVFLERSSNDIQRSMIHLGNFVCLLLIESRQFLPVRIVTI